MVAAWYIPSRGSRFNPSSLDGRQPVRCNSWSAPLDAVEFLGPSSIQHDGFFSSPVANVHTHRLGAHRCHRRQRAHGLGGRTFPSSAGIPHPPPGAALRSLDGLGRKSASVPRVVCGVFFFLVAFSLVISAGFADSLGVTTPAPMFNLAINAGGSSLIAVYLLCPQIAGFIFWVLTGVFSRTGLVVSALGTRSAASRVQVSATTIAPLAAGLGSIGLLLCSVNSVIAFAEIFQPDGQANRADTWMMVIVIALMMLATSAAVVALSASGREHEIALLQAAGMRGRQVVAMIASESFAMSLAASIIAAVPVAFGGLVFVLASQATLGGGTAVVAWPVPAMLVGLIASWAALFIILLAPALTPLREGPSTQLRQQEI